MPRLLFALALLLLPDVASAQLWSGVLDPARAIRWQDNAGVPGGIPSASWTQCGATLNPGVTMAQITSAIAACGSNQYVQLAAGTFTLTSGTINFAAKSNVALRGMGPLSTILKISGSGGCFITAFICVAGSGNYTPSPQRSTTWTAGYAKGTTTITLGNAAGIVAGQVLYLDQDNDLLDTGQVLVCDSTVNDASHVGCISAGNSVPDSRNCNGATTSVTGLPVSGCTGQTKGRTSLQIVSVVSVNGNNVTISPGLYLPNWRSSQNPGAWWPTTVIKNVGIENMTLDFLAASGGQHGIFAFNAYGCWVKNVRILKGDGMRSGMQAYLTGRCTVRDSYFYGEHNGGGAQDYGLETFLTSDLLAENNIFEKFTSHMLIGTGTGVVLGYNFGINDTSTSNFLWSSITVHDVTAYGLIEGNDTYTLVYDDVHGPHNFETTFRNRLGRQVSGKTAETSAGLLFSHSRYFHYVGNVLGTGGYHTNYQSAVPTNASCDRSIYNLGWANTSCANDSVLPQDALVQSTLMRWGNYDTVNNAVRFQASESGVDALVFPGLLNPSQTLPASFYLTSRPSAWWGTPQGTPPWPPLGPDVTTGNLSEGTGAAANLGGHANKIPSRLCYENTAKDTANYGSLSPVPLAFNASTCYLPAGGDTTPSVPTSVTLQ